MNNFDEFYPTPIELLEDATEGCDFKRIRTILEPSAGKGDIVEFLMKKAKENYMEYGIDCMEIEPELRSILTGKGMRVIHDDFLSYHGHKKYDLIIMNPPFSNGDEHLLKALEIQKNGGSIICILNAETIRNPYSLKRKELMQRLKDYHYYTEISFHKQPFENAERKTLVDVAVIRVDIPKKEEHSFIFDELRRAKAEKTWNEEPITDIAENDYISAIIKRYEIETEACLELIREYRAMRPYIMGEVKDTKYSSPILELKVAGKDVEEGSENKVLEKIRMKYWKALFSDSRFTGKMTSKQREDYMNKVSELKHYDFSYYNIKTIQIQMAENIVKGIEECIISLFDELSYEYSWLPETGRNIHYYNGWATNKAHIINKKVIIPMHDVFSSIWKMFRYSYTVAEKLSDIEKVFDYLAGAASADSHIYERLRLAEERQESKNIELRYFTVTFYKKGTCHITFNDEELLKKFNIFGSQKKGWLPPCYGKKRYQDMNSEEQHVINEFEGRESYEKVQKNPSKYILKLSEYIPKLTVN